MAIAMPKMPSVTGPPLVLLLLAASFAASQAGIHCGPQQQPPAASPAASPSPSSSNTTNGGKFHDNLQSLLLALPDAAAPTGFASLSSGTGFDRVFVRGLCRGDSSPSQCLADLQSGTIDLIASCSSSRRAAGFYDKCIVTYADINASTASYGFEEDMGELLYDGRKVADPDSYNKTYYALMQRLVARAAGGGGNGSARMFATGEAEYTRAHPNGTMYGLVQCMRDLTAAECDRCLQASVPQLPRCCFGYEGGVARSFNCHLRIQIYTYYDLAPIPSPLSTQDKRRKRRLEHVILAVSLSVGTLVLVVVLLLVRRRRKRIKANKEQQGIMVELDSTEAVAMITRREEDRSVYRGLVQEIKRLAIHDEREIFFASCSRSQNKCSHELASYGRCTPRTAVWFYSGIESIVRLAEAEKPP